MLSHRLLMILFNLRGKLVPEQDNLEKMILSTGIRSNTVKTKYMMPFIIRANPEGLYILDISKTLTH